MDRQTTIQYLKIGVLMAIIIALGMVAINQTFGYYYKAKFLYGPCQLCEELNDVKCVREINPIQKINITMNKTYGIS